MTINRRDAMKALAATAGLSPLAVLASTGAAPAPPLPGEFDGAPSREVYDLMAFALWRFDEIYLPERGTFHRAIEVEHMGLRFESDPQTGDPDALKLVTDLDGLSERNRIYATTACAQAARITARRIALIRSARGHQGAILFRQADDIDRPFGKVPYTADAPALLPRPREA
jgi:hypothetical protein